MLEVIQDIDEVILCDGLVSNHIFELANPAVKETVGLFVDLLVITVQEASRVFVLLEEVFAALAGDRGRALVFGAIEVLKIFFGVFALPMTGLLLFLFFLGGLRIFAFLLLAFLQLQESLTWRKGLKLILFRFWLGLRRSRTPYFT